MTSAHGAEVVFGNRSLTLQRSPLAAALHGEDQVTIDLEGLDSTLESQAPTNANPGFVRLSFGDDASRSYEIAFAPNSAKDFNAFLREVHRAASGDLAADNPVVGLDFVELRADTASSQASSLCHLVATKFEHGRRTKESFEMWCQPATQKLDDSAPSSAEVSKKKWEKAPDCAELLSGFFEFLGGTNTTVVAHNVDAVMRTLLHSAEAAEFVLPTQVQAICSYALAREKDLGQKTNSLSGLAEALDLKDRSAGAVFVELARMDQWEGSAEEYAQSCGFHAGVLGAEGYVPMLNGADYHAAVPELDAMLVARRAKNEEGGQLSLDWGALSADSGQSEKSSGKAAAQSKPQSSRGPAPWSRVATPDEIPEPNLDADPEGALFQQHVALSGDFAPYDKEQLWDGIAHKGGLVQKNVTKKTTVFIAGPWKGKTTKHKRAEELQSQGQDIQIWDEKRLYEELGLSEEPPF